MPSDALSELIAAVRACPFDLTARARLAAEACANLTDPALGGLPYSYVELHTDPPVAMHTAWDYGDTLGHLLEARTLALIMTGDAPDERDATSAALLASFQRDDGMMVVPSAAWTRPTSTIELEWTPRGALMAWTTRYLALDDREALQCAQKLVGALYRAAVWDQEVCWFPESYFPLGGWLNRQPPLDKGGDILLGAQNVLPLARFAAATGNEQAERLASGLIQFVRRRSGAFGREGRMTEKSARYLHSNAAFLKAALSHAIVKGDEDTINWVQANYETLRSMGTNFGFFPHRSEGADRWQGDIAILKDMIEIASLLAQRVDHSYYLHVERYGRNQLLECQLLDTDWATQESDIEFPQTVWCQNHPPEGVTADNVPERVLGGFASWSLLNDAFDATNPRLSMRSTAAGARALYSLWHNAVTRTDEAVRVNLHFSRDTRWANVTSHLPREGRVDVLMKTRGVLAVRVPDHLTTRDVVVMVNEQRQRNEAIRGGYAWVEALRNGDSVTVTWPLAKRTETYTLQEQEYTLDWQEDMAVSIEPAGRISPLYRRLTDAPPALAYEAHGVAKEITPL